MRSRLIRASYWGDAKMAALPLAVRYTYIGLWGLADDAGYLVWDIREIAAEIFRYESVKRRENAVIDALDQLMAAGRVKLLDCRKHALIPTLPAYGPVGGKRVTSIEQAHLGCSPASSGTVPETPGESVSYRLGLVGSESVGLDSAREEGLPHIDDATAHLVEELTGRSLLQGGYRQLTELDRLIEDHGPEKVQAALRTVAAAHKGPLTARQLVWPAMKLLEPLPTAKDIAAAEDRQPQPVPAIEETPLAFTPVADPEEARRQWEALRQVLPKQAGVA